MMIKEAIESMIERDQMCTFHAQTRASFEKNSPGCLKSPSSGAKLYRVLNF